jgi:hypothetical protein
MLRVYVMFPEIPDQYGFDPEDTARVIRDQMAESFGQEASLIGWETWKGPSRSTSEQAMMAGMKSAMKTAMERGIDLGPSSGIKAVRDDRFGDSDDIEVMNVSVETVTSHGVVRGDPAVGVPDLEIDIGIVTFSDKKLKKRHFWRRKG